MESLLETVARRSKGDDKVEEEIRARIEQIESFLKDEECPECKGTTRTLWLRERKALILSLGKDNPFKIRRCRDGETRSKM